ncbi:MAG TPA: patatin-like phospholipase family protein [Gemmatimonadaceae bacterium]
MPRFPIAEQCPANARAVAQAHPPYTVLVLGGGAMHGMAHIGVIRALVEARIEIDAIVGTSIGALVGARWAAGASVDELEADALSVTEPAVLKRNLKTYMIGGLAQVSVYDGVHYRDLIQRIIAPATFASLLRPLRVNALSLRNGDERWFGSGADSTLGLVDAIYASGALPLIFPPLMLYDGDILVDGGLKTMVGLLEAIRWGARRIIAIDVSEAIDADDVAWQREGLVGIHGRVVQILAEPQREAIQSARGRVPTLHIRPPVNRWASFTFTATRELIDTGYEAVKDALAAPSSALFHAAAPIGPAIVRRRA